MLFLSGGGLDSVAYIILEHKNIDTVMSVDYGQVGFSEEVEATKNICKKYGLNHIIEYTSIISEYNRGRDVSLFTGNIEDDAYVNGRNLALIMLALKYDKDIMLGFTNPGYKPFPDADEEFVALADEMIKRVFRGEGSVIAPYINTLRTDVFKEAYKLDNELFDISMTCWTPKNGKECGECKHCKLKKQQKELVLNQLKEEGFIL